MSEVIQVGDTVQLKSGSPLMTVTDSTKKGIYVCSFFDHIEGCPWTFGTLYAHPSALIKIAAGAIYHTEPFSNTNGLSMGFTTLSEPKVSCGSCY